MITIKTNEEIEKLREGGKHLANILDVLESAVRPGMKTGELNDIAERMIAENGDTASFLNYRPSGVSRPFPASLCVCINEEIVHGVSNEDERTIKQGDLVTVDLGVTHDNLITDSARTVGAGKLDKVSQELLWTTTEALAAGIDAARGGGNIGDIGAAVQAVVKKTPFVIIEELVGHGVGYSVHEDPFVPNKGVKGEGPELKPGMVLAIEVMLAEHGSGGIAFAPDGWTYVTPEGGRSAQVEHTVVITDGEAEILTLSQK
ncbi:type I methionyl aminopeptidase [Candidatus Wolfebacteria bacterium]|nr:MAG: type I methionyl aminopeptidase [Candidatus Wolfebacteria bacterium]